MLQALLAIIIKNMQRLLRSKLSAATIIAGPILIIILAGITFSQSGLQGISAGMYAPDSDEITNSIVDAIKASDYAIVTYDDKDTCIDMVRNGKHHICMEIVDQSGKKYITFHVDFSNINLVYTLVSALSERLTGASDKISFEIADKILTDSRVAIQTLTDNAESIQTFKEDLANFQDTLNKVSQDLDGLDQNYTIDASGIDIIEQEIDSTQGTIDNSTSNTDVLIEDYLVQVQELKDSVDLLDTEATDWQTSLTETKVLLEDTYDQLACDSQQYLFDLVDADELADELNSTATPVCALLYSSIQELEEREAVVNDAVAQVGDLQTSVDEAEQGLLDTQTQLDGVTNQAQTSLTVSKAQLTSFKTNLADAQEKIAQAQAQKQNIVTQIAGANTLLANSLSQVDTINDELQTAKDLFTQATGSTADQVVNPIVTDIKAVTGEKELLDYIFPSILVLVITFNGILLASTLVMKERTTPAYFRNVTAPVPDVLYVFGIYATSIIIVASQVALLSAFAAFAFNVSVVPHILPLIIVLFIICTVFLLTGICIGYLFKSEETTTLAAIAVSCVLFLFSNLLAPLESMDKILASVFSISPFVIAEDVLRRILIFELPLTDLIMPVLGLCAYIIVLIAVSLWAQKMRKDAIIG